MISKTLASDYRSCKRIIDKNSKTFSMAFSILPSPKKEAVWALYALNRRLDDIVDQSPKALSLEEEQQKLRRLQAGQIPSEAVYRALADVDKTFGIDYEAFDAMFTGQYQDLSFSQPETEADLLDYCYYVAGSVGHMLLPVLATKNASLLRDSAKKLGIAMQLTNILRDVGEDFHNQRIYLPVNILEQEQVSLPTVIQTGVTDAYIKVWEHYAKLAESYYQAGLEQLDLYDEDSRLVVKAAAELYREILTAVRKQDYRLDKRAMVPRAIKRNLLRQMSGIPIEPTL